MGQLTFDFSEKYIGAELEYQYDYLNPILNCVNLEDKDINELKNRGFIVVGNVWIFYKKEVLDYQI
jgi:hypothetical protein